METAKISLVIVPTDPQARLGVRVKLDQNIMYETDHVDREIVIEQSRDLEDGDHTLSIELYNKLPEHTKIAENGSIVSDATIKIQDLALDDILLAHEVQQIMVYSHDTNGSQPLQDHKFYGEMGCNGQVRLVFTAPIYLWLLEHI